MAIYIQGQLNDFMNIYPCVYVIVWPIFIFIYFERFLLECEMLLAEGHLFTPGGGERGGEDREFGSF